VRWYSDPYTTMPKAVVNATDFYWLPTNRLVELGEQIII
jgi:K+ transporter